MFGNTVLSFEDYKSLEDVCINQEKIDLENFNLNQIRYCVPAPDYFTSSLPFPECEGK